MINMYGNMYCDLNFRGYLRKIGMDDVSPVLVIVHLVFFAGVGGILGQ